MRQGRQRGALFPYLVNLFACLCWTGFIAALLGAFNAWAVLGAGSALSLGTWRLMRAGAARWLPDGGPRERAWTAAAWALLLLVFLLNAALFHDSFIGTRDEGIYSNDAAYLAEHGDLPYPSLDGYDTRLFANTSWNATLYGLGGFSAVALCNVIPACLALFCIYLLVRELTGRHAAGLAAVSLIAFCYPFLWFLRRTANEAFFFSVFWISAYLLSRCLEGRESFRTDFCLFALVLPLAAFVRPEGWVVLGVGICAAAYACARRGRRPGLPAVLAAVLILLMAGALVGGYLHLKDKYAVGYFVEENVSAPRAGPAPYGSQPLRRHGLQYSSRVLLEFGLVPAVLCLAPFFLLLLLDPRRRSFGAALLLLSLAFFYYLYKPNIFFDLPWFTRRFVTVVIPLSLVAFVCVVCRLPRWPAAAVCGAYLGLTLLVSSPVLAHREYRGMFSAVAQVAGMIPEDVPVLVDLYAAGEYGPGDSLKFVHGKDVVSVSQYKAASAGDIAGAGAAFPDAVMLVTNEENYRGVLAKGAAVFERSVQVTGSEVVGELEVSYPYLVPTCQFHRGGYLDTWLLTDYRVAVSQVKAPSAKEERRYRILVARLEVAPAEP